MSCFLTIGPPEVIVRRAFSTSEVLEGPYTAGGGGGGVPPGPSPPQTKGTIAGKHEVYNRENLVGPFLADAPPTQGAPRRRG